MRRRIYGEVWWRFTVKRLVPSLSRWHRKTTPKVYGIRRELPSRILTKEAFAVSRGRPMHRAPYCEFVLSRVVQATLTGEKSIPPEPPSDDQAEEAETQLGRAGRHPHRAAVRGARLAPPRSGRKRRRDRRYGRDRAGPRLPGRQPSPRTDGRPRRHRDRTLGGRRSRTRSVICDLVRDPAW